MPSTLETAGPAFTFGQVELKPDAPLQSWLNGMQEAFAAAGIRTPLIDARLMLSHALGISQAQLGAEPGRPIIVGEGERLSALVKRRLAREPMSRILGLKKFYGRTFRLTSGILDPRRDTETLVTLALATVRKENRANEPLQILDLGVGAGNILVTLLAELPKAAGLGVDLSEECLEVSRANAADLGVADRCRLQQANWLEGVTGAFDLITANPPYMTDEGIAGLAPEAGAYDPRLALDGGADGLAAYRAIIPALEGVLAPGGRVVFQVGEGQAPSVEQMLHNFGFQMENREASVRRDAFGIERAIAAKRPASAP